MELHQRVTQLREANQAFLLQYRWEWFCTLNMPPNSDCAAAEEKLKAWRISMGILHHIMIAYMGVYNTIPHPHIHLLVLGKRNAAGETLLDFNPRRWETKWGDLNIYRDVKKGRRLTKPTAVIEVIGSCDGVASYITTKNLPWERAELIQPYNKRLLNKSMYN